MRKFLVWFFLLLIVGGGLYTYWFYFNKFADGQRDGLLQKFSRKGNVFKTYEGELLMSGFGQRNGGFQAQYFYFSVEDPKIAQELEKNIGNNVKVHYIQYRRSLPWRGDSYNGKNDEKGQYIVDQVISTASSPDQIDYQSTPIDNRSQQRDNYPSQQYQ